MEVQFPQELIDAIVDHVSTLKDCSMVSRAFRVSCRRYMFSNLRLGPLEEPSSDPDHLVANTCQRFHDLLSSSPDIALCVQYLQIDDNFDDAIPPSESDGFHYEGFNQWPYDGHRHPGKSWSRTGWIGKEPTFPYVLSALLNLQRVSLDGNGTRWRHLPPDHLDSMYALFRLPTLSRLEIAKWWFKKEDFIPMFQDPVFFTHLSFIENAYDHISQYFLVMPDANGNRHEPEPEPPAVNQTFLKTFRISLAREMVPFVDFILNKHSTLSLTRLETLSIPESSVADLAYVNRILRNASRTLAYLELGSSTCRYSFRTTLFI